MSTRIVRGGVGGLVVTVAAVGSVLAPGIASAADTSPPPSPTNLRVESVTFTSVALAWNPSADDSGWVTYEAEAASLPRSLQRFGSTEPRQLIPHLIPGLTYTASVVAVDGSRNRSAPVSVEFTTPVDSTAPTVPGNLRASTARGVVDAISWEAAADQSAVRYVIRSSGVYIFGTTQTSVTAFKLVNLDFRVLPGSTHTLTVEAQDAHGNISARSAPLTVTFPS